MKPRIFSDIFVKKIKNPLTDGRFFEEKSEKNITDKQSQFTVDLTGDHVIHSAPDHANAQPLGTVAAKRPQSRTTAILIQLITLAGISALILFIMASMRSISSGEKLLANLAQTAKSGYRELITGGKEINGQRSSTAANMFEQAYIEFTQAQEKIWFLSRDPILSKYTSVLESGKLLADSGKEMVEIMEIMKQIPALFAQDMNHVAATRDTATPTALSMFKIVHAKIIAVHSDVKIASDNFQRIKNDIPDGLNLPFSNGLLLLKQSKDLLAEIAAMLPGMIELLGNGKPHRTLIVLQNNDEVRPTGGFIGSFINLLMENGHVVELKLEDVYDLDGQFNATAKREDHISPPPELASLTDRWFFRDANYSSDFTISGEKLLWFYKRERLQNADSVIAANQNLLGRLLEITGPIEVPELSAPLSTSNYREVLTYMIETKRTGADDPKKILKDLMPIIQSRLFQSKNMEAFQEVLLEEIVQKNILGYSSNSLVQDFFGTLGSDGKTYPAAKNEDYISVIATSLGGNKSDAYVTQNIEHDTVIDHDGSIYDQLTIKRAHTWSGATEAKWRTLLKPFGFTDFPEHFLTIFGKGDNIVHLRAYLPDDSEIISTENIITQPLKNPQPEPILQLDSNTKRSYIPFTMLTRAGTVNTVKIRYRLPLRLNNMLTNTYTINIQKQPGSRTTQFTKRIIFDDYMPLAQTYPQTGFVQETPTSLVFTRPLVRDQRFSLLFARESMLKRGTAAIPADIRQ